MKKGFTLIEIIISIGIILLLGTITSFIFIRKNNKNDLQHLENQIFNAAQLYVTTEYDNLGNKYINGITKGGEGVIIPLNDLEKAGYIPESTKENILKFVNSEDTYVIVGYKNDEECNSGATITAGWVDKTTYICGFGEKNAGTTIYDKITSSPYSTGCNNSLYTSSSLCMLHGTNISDPNSDGTYDDVWYYKGKTTNNYLKFSGLNNVFRIVRTTENGNVKIASDTSVLCPMRKSRSATVGVPWSTGEWRVDYSRNYPRIYLNGFKLEKYVTSSSNEYTCDTTNNTSSWSDSKKVNCGGTLVQSPIYTNIYKPLNDFYNHIKPVIEKYIDKDYKWCTSTNSQTSTISDSFKCSTTKTLSENFGLLTAFEYKNIQYIEAIDDDSYNQYFYNHFLNSSSVGSTSELVAGTTNFPSTAIVNPYTFWISSSVQPVYLRPTFVIKGNSKVIDGTGEQSNPWIIGE